MTVRLITADRHPNRAVRRQHFGVFLLLVLDPGDPVDVLLGESAQAADREAMRAAPASTGHCRNAG